MHEDQLEHGATLGTSRGVCEANDLGTVLQIGRDDEESFCGMDSLLVLLFQEENWVCSLVGMDDLSKYDLVYIAERAAMMRDRRELKGRWEDHLPKMRLRRSLSWCLY